MIGAPRVHHRVTDSTNERAKELAAAGAPHGTVVTADEQTAGRGRQGRTWTAPRRSAVLMSLVLRDLGESTPMLPLAAAVAVCEACESAAGVRCEIKWPNDVWIEGRKLAGILVEARPAGGWAVVGIGLNVSTTGDELPPELRGTATSLRAAASVEDVLAALLNMLERWLIAPPAEVLSELRARDALRGKQLRWEGGSGVAAGIDDSGALIVETTAGRQTLDAGEVHLET
jgi:BirA family transcriptional regulator, biotin operon repressor / biotin---[acetyl-CoA-carboxylase] ligase